MPDKLYRSHSLEFSDEGTSGTLTIWEDSPVSPFNVGDTFRPVPQSPQLTVEKVSIKDNVIGEANGKTLRQWEVTIEGSNFDNELGHAQTHIKYNFNIAENEKSGTMEVVNQGDNPALSLDIGDTFSVPGIGEVTCVKVSGNDSYNDDNVHSWTVTYEGSDNPEQSSDDDALPDTKYSLSIQKDNDGDIQKSGSMSVVHEGNAPVFNVSVGDNFDVPGIGQIKCTKVSASDEYSNSGSHRWTVNYEGIFVGSSDDDNPDEQDVHAKYSFSIDNDSLSGSVEFTAAGNEPVFAHNVGDTISLPGIGEVTCTKISGSDSYSDNGKRKWTVIYEASNETLSQEQQDSNIKYSLSIENNSDGITIYSGTKEFSCAGDVPVPDIEIGDKFSLPLVGELTCTKIQSSNNEPNLWTITIEGSRGGNDAGDDDEQELPENETTISYEINGSTVRSVAGEFITLRRSDTPITKKSITVYSASPDPIAAPGETYEGGIVTSENISKETIKNNGVVTATYYKHSIEVEL